MAGVYGGQMDSIASKFAEYPNYGRAKKGHFALQGDHGVISFRNVKIRPIDDKK